MKHQGPIIIIEDDIDDVDLFEEIFAKFSYPNERIYFRDGTSALLYLEKMSTSPFIIISDINLPLLNGFDLIAKLKANPLLQLKCIPYIFFTTTASHNAVIKAYGLSAHGFFVKPNSLNELEKIISVMVEYWSLSQSPSSLLSV